VRTNARKNSALSALGTVRILLRCARVFLMHGIKSIYFYDGVGAFR
jgi:hypothetical protein